MLGRQRRRFMALLGWSLSQCDLFWMGSRHLLGTDSI